MDNKERDDKINDRKIARARAKMAGRQTHDEDDEEETKANELELIMEIDKEELTEAEKELKEARKIMEEAKERLAVALAAVTVAKRRVEGREQGLLVDVTERTAWNKRLMAAHELPEHNDEEILKKYTEMASVFNDFVHCAKMYGETIINELFIEVDDKSIKPIEWRETDQKNLEGTIAQKPRFVYEINRKCPYWQVCNIRFIIAVDDDGMYYGNIDACAKAYGNKLRGSIGYIKCYVPGMQIPMMCLVDFRGFRLMAEAVMPLTVKKYDQYGISGKPTIFVKNDISI